MNYSHINKEWKDMFIDRPETSLPPLRPDKFSFLLQNLRVRGVRDEEIQNMAKLIDLDKLIATITARDKF